MFKKLAASNNNTFLTNGEAGFGCQCQNLKSLSAVCVRGLAICGGVGASELLFCLAWLADLVIVKVYKFRLG